MNKLQAVIFCVFLSFTNLIHAEETGYPARVWMFVNQTQACNDFEVSYSVPIWAESDKDHWLSIEKQGDEPSKLTYRQKFLPQSSATGTVTFTSKGMAPGDYEARLHLSWVSTHSYEIAARRNFTIYPNQYCTVPRLHSSDTQVEVGQPVSFSFRNMVPATQNWVSIGRTDTPPHENLKSVYLPNVSSGSGTINTLNLPRGSYELRLFGDWATIKDYFVYDRVQFRIGAAFPPPSLDNRVRVWGERNLLQVYISNSQPGWYGVCDDHFDRLDGEVACRALGQTYVSHRSENGGALFGMDNLNCRGSERTLFECGYVAWNSHDCAPTENISLICR